MKKHLIILFCAGFSIHATLAQEVSKSPDTENTNNQNKSTPNRSTMDNQSLTTTLVVDQTPKEVFNAINNVRGWWSEEIEGATDKLNDVFTYHYEDVHLSKMKLIEVIPNKKVVWLVLENKFNFTKDKNEWTGNKVIFEITEKDNKTHLQFTQLGLVPEYECYTICKDAWGTYIHKSLYSLITTGKGQPNGKGKPRTENEKKLVTGNK